MKRNFIVVAALCALCAQPLFAEDAPLAVAALRLGVTDLQPSAAFYVQHCGFQVTNDSSADGFIVLMNHAVPLVLTRAATPIDVADDQCHVRFNFKTDDLDRTVAAMKSAGVRFVGEGKSAVGRYATFVDPSGNRHNMKQLFDQKDPLPTPEVYDVGVAVSDMTKARAFYADTLGFEVMTEKYYPPVVPFQQRGAAFFILADGASPKLSKCEYGKTAWSGMAFESRDIAASMKTLRERGVRLLDEQPRRVGPVLCAAFVDPFGNPLELIEHVRQPEVAAASGSNANTVSPEFARGAFERLKQMAGEWEGKSTKGWVEKISYKVIAGGSCVLESSFDAHPNEQMVTLFHMDVDRLLLTHYCVAKNQPRLMLTAATQDLSEMTFTFLDGTNLPSRDRGHMDKVVFRFAGPDRFTSQWTWYQDGKENWMEEIVHTRVGKE